MIETSIDFIARELSPGWAQFSNRFNCCRRTTTLLCSSGGVGWFSCLTLWANDTEHSQANPPSPDRTGSTRESKMLCYPRKCFDVPVHPSCWPRETTATNGVQHQHTPEDCFKV